MLPKLYIVTLDELLGIFQRGLIVGAHKSNCSADKTVFVHDVSSILGHIGVTPKVTTDHINPGTSVRFRNHCDGVSLNRLPWNHGNALSKKNQAPELLPRPELTGARVISARSAIHGSFHFLEDWFDMRDLGAVLDREEPLPHPAGRPRLDGGSSW